jgi:hypothetical protein
MISSANEQTRILLNTLKRATLTGQVGILDVKGDPVPPTSNLMQPEEASQVLQVEKSFVLPCKKLGMFTRT